MRPETVMAVALTLMGVATGIICLIFVSFIFICLVILILDFGFILTFYTTLDDIQCGKCGYCGKGWGSRKKGTLSCPMCRAKTG